MISVATARQVRAIAERWSEEYDVPMGDVHQLFKELQRAKGNASFTQSVVLLNKVLDQKGN